MRGLDRWRSTSSGRSAGRSIAADGPRWTYRQDRRSGEYEPHPDPRTLPRLSFRLSEAAIHHVGESS